MAFMNQPQAGERSLADQSGCAVDPGMGRN